MPDAMAKGAGRRGESVVAGLLRCGHCGRRLQVMSTGGARGPSVRYQCGTGRLSHGLQRGCFSVGALRVDEAIEREVLRVVAPGAIEAALDAAHQADAETEATRGALDLELGQARCEADRAPRTMRWSRRTGWSARRSSGAGMRRWRGSPSWNTGWRPAHQRRRRSGSTARSCWRSRMTCPRCGLKKRIGRLLIEEIVATAMIEPPESRWSCPGRPARTRSSWCGRTGPAAIGASGHRCGPRPRALPPGWRDRSHPQPPRVSDRPEEGLDRCASGQPALWTPDRCGRRQGSDVMKEQDHFPWSPMLLISLKIPLASVLREDIDGRTPFSNPCKQRIRRGPRS